MVTQKVMEALRIRVELALWKGRRSIYGARRKALKSEYVLKKDVVDRMERSVLKHFSLFGANYEDKLAKENWEANEAKKAYEKVVFYIEEGEKRISELERQAEGLRTVEACSNNKEQEGSSFATENGIERTRKSLIVWCELVEEAISIADSVTSFLTDLLVCIERSNNAKARGGEINGMQIGACAIVEKVNYFFKRLQQEYGELEKWNSIKHINAKRIVLVDEGNMRGEIQENALLYTIQKEMEELQKLLVETFAAMEDDGERLLEKLKRESGNTGNLVTDERGKIEEKSIKNVFTDHLENKYEKQEESFPSYARNKIDIQQKAVFPEEEFHGEENSSQEREALLEGIRLLQEELKSVRGEIQKGFKRSRGRLFGKCKMDVDEEEEVPAGIKKLEGNIEAWRRGLKEFRRKTRHFPCALDGFVSVESRRLNRCFENENAVAGQAWYFMYVDDLETGMKTTEKQLMDFRIDD